VSRSIQFMVTRKALGPVESPVIAFASKEREIDENFSRDNRC
jgi:hypothetical protein